MYKYNTIYKPDICYCTKFRILYSAALIGMIGRESFKFPDALSDHQACQIIAMLAVKIGLRKEGWRFVFPGILYQGSLQH